MSDPAIDLPNACRPESNLLTGGQPSRGCLEAAAKAGYHTVVNLRPQGEFDDSDEAAAVRELGMDYVCIPVAGPQDLNADAAEALDAVLATAGGRPVLVHCASGNRVGALFALHARLKKGVGVEEALARGRATGLTAPALCEAVRAILQRRN